MTITFMARLEIFRDFLMDPENCLQQEFDKLIEKRFFKGIRKLSLETVSELSFCRFSGLF